MNAEAQVNTRRLIWRCRRGLLELDIVLQQFIRQHLDHLTPMQLHALEGLLEYQDNELLDLITGKEKVADTEAARLLALIAGVHGAAFTGSQPG